MTALTRARLQVQRELGVDIGPLPPSRAIKLIDEAAAVVEMRVSEIADGVARGIIAALGGDV